MLDVSDGLVADLNYVAQSSGVSPVELAMQMLVETALRDTGSDEKAAEMLHLSKAEMLKSVREPLTVGRFFKNLVGAVGSTRLVIPHDPIDAEPVRLDQHGVL